MKSDWFRDLPYTHTHTHTHTHGSKYPKSLKLSLLTATWCIGKRSYSSVLAVDGFECLVSQLYRLTNCLTELFIDRPCKKRADDLPKLIMHQLKMVTATYTVHAPVRGHLYTVGLFDGDPVCRFCGMETETVQHIICCCEALARQRYSVFGRRL